MPIRALAMLLAAATVMAAPAAAALADDVKVRVLFVGGDWKSQLPNYQGRTPLRGWFVRDAVEKAAPGKFDLTLWTSYEFLQYGDSESLRQFDAIVCGDLMGQSVMPRLVKGLADFVQGGGGFWYCDNHKAFMFYTKELSFDAVMPIETVPFRAYGPEPSQPLIKEDLTPKVVAADHPILGGLDLAAMPPLRGARHGKPKAGAKVLATGPGGEPIWVAWEVGRGRSLWTGGVFSNDEMSEGFAKWSDFGRFYAQALAWLAARSAYPRIALKGEVAAATLTVDLARKGPELTSRHFGIHGQESSGPGDRGMQGEDLAQYQALNLDGTFARIGAAADAPRRVQGGKQWDYQDMGTGVAEFDWAKYDFSRLDAVLKDCLRIKAEPISLYWCPWGFKDVDMRPERWTRYFAAVLEHTNGSGGLVPAPARLKYFEIMNEPSLEPAAQRVPQYAEFFNYAAGSLKKRYPGVLFGCGGFYEWPYIMEVVDRTAENIGWISRHPYGHTGEAVFALGDKYIEHASAKGLKDLKYVITEWDFWIYGEPAFDYIMQRWKPLADHADTCLGSLHYRWREYHEGGYVFGLHGEFDQKYGELPPEWPNPGKNKVITYRYNAFWLMRDARGPQFAATVDSAQIASSESTRLWAIATARDSRFNIVAYYGYPYASLKEAKSYGKVRLRVRSPIPPEVKGRTLVVSRGDCKTIREEPPREVKADTLDLEIEVPALSGVSLTVK
jgi:uncharacterized membrane protein